MHHIRPMSDRDVPEIVLIAEESALSRWHEADYYAEILRHDAICLSAAAREEGLSGFIVGRIVPGDSEAAHNAEIYNVGVRSLERRTGVGSALLDAFLLQCIEKGVEKIWLEVRESNAAARRLYSARGFTEKAVRKGFYSQPIENAVVLALDLTRLTRQQINKS